MSGPLLMAAVAIIGFAWAAWADSRERTQFARDEAERPTLKAAWRAARKDGKC